MMEADTLADLPRARRYLVAVSGGRDSVALLHWLLAQDFRRLIVCHFEHGLRGRAGKGDARFVERLAQKHALPFEAGAADIGALAQERRQSIETTARQERLAFFAQVAKRRRCPTIFLAHHADDQVETFLLNLFRGAAGRGLGAMRVRAKHGSLTLVRPLLGVWRAQIDEYIAQHCLKFREDATNQELTARRNLMRHKIIPWLEKQLGRNIRATIWRAATVLAEEEDVLEALTPASLTKRKTLETASLRALPSALQRRVVRRWLMQQAVADVGFEDVEEVRRLLGGGAPAQINLAKGRHARRRAGKIFLE